MKPYNYGRKAAMSHWNGMETEGEFLLHNQALTRSVPETELYPLCVYFKTGGVVLKHRGHIILGDKREKHSVTVA